MILITEQDEGTTVTVGRNDLLRITLSENASTGYRWAVDQVDKGVLEPVDSEAKYDANLVGAIGEVNFLFRARSEGVGEIRLKNWRHWEGDSSITRRFHVRVRVHP